MQNGKKMQTMDGNCQQRYASYAFTEVAGIYPITFWYRHMIVAAIEKLVGVPVKLVEMQSEAGANGAVCGLVSWSFNNYLYSFTRLLLKYLTGMQVFIRLRCTAELLAKFQALSIFGDHI